MDNSLFRVYGMGCSSIRLINGLLRQSTFFAGRVVALPQHVPFLVALEALLVVVVVIGHLRGHGILKFVIFCLVSHTLHDSSLVLLLLRLLLAEVGISCGRLSIALPVALPIALPIAASNTILAVPDEDAPL